MFRDGKKNIASAHCCGDQDQIHGLAIVRALQRLLEPLAIRDAGDHLPRDPLDHLADLGFWVEFCGRSRAGLVERVVARKGNVRLAELLLE